MPHDGHARCGSLAALHCGQIDTEGGVRKSCALLMFLRDLDVFFLGTAIKFLLYCFTLKPLRGLNTIETFVSLHLHAALLRSAPQVKQRPLQSSEQSGL